MKLPTPLEQYIILKMSLGFRFETARRILMAFSRALGEVNLAEVEPTAVRAYLDGDGPVTRTWALKWRTLRCFYRFAQARGLARRSPLPHRPPKVTTSFTPYIYTDQELRQLLEAITPKRAAGLTPRTVRALLLLLYGAGLRISEALQLEDADVELKDRLLRVRCSKFFKTRLVPIGPRLAQSWQSMSASVQQPKVLIGASSGARGVPRSAAVPSTESLGRCARRQASSEAMGLITSLGCTICATPQRSIV